MRTQPMQTHWSWLLQPRQVYQRRLYRVQALALHEHELQQGQECPLPPRELPRARPQLALRLPPFQPQLEQLQERGR